MLGNEKYINTIKDYLNKLKEQLNDNLKMLFIIGSSCSNRMVENWSDIDCILVLDKYDINEIQKIKSLSNSYDIKIGNTIYCKKEFENGLIDGKTYYHLLLHNEKMIDIQYKSNDLSLPIVDYKTCVQQTKIILMGDIHNCKRLLLYENMTKEQLKTLFKKIYVIMKSILIINNLRPKNYYETFNMFCEKYNYNYFDYMEFINDYRNNNIDEEKIKNYAFNFINFIVENIEL